MARKRHTPEQIIGKLRAIESHPDNKATPEGVCIKGLSYIERVYAKDRILYALKGTETGEFERISWAEALTTIAQHLESVKDRFGPRSLFFYAGSGTKGLLNGIATDFWRLFGFPFLAPRMLDRGTMIEKEWKSVMENPGCTLDTWRARIGKGEIPIPVFNATLVQDGRRFLLSPMTFSDSKEQGAVSFAYRDVGEGYEQEQ